MIVIMVTEALLLCGGYTRKGVGYKCLGLFLVVVEKIQEVDPICLVGDICEIWCWPHRSSNFHTRRG